MTKVRPVNVKDVTKAGGLAGYIEKHIQDLTTGTAEQKEVAAGFLRGLTEHDHSFGDGKQDNRELIAQAGGIVPLSDLVATGMPEGQAIALGALANIVAVKKEYQEALVAAQGVTRVAGCLKAGGAHTQAAAAAAMAALTQLHSTQKAFVEAGTVPCLVSLLKNGSVILQVHAANTIANLAKNNKLGQTIIGKTAAIQMCATHAHAHARTRARARAHTRTRTRAHAHAHAHTYTRTRTHTRTRAHTRTCTRRRTHTHTYTHTAPLLLLPLTRRGAMCCHGHRAPSAATVHGLLPHVFWHSGAAQPRAAARQTVHAPTPDTHTHPPPCPVHPLLASPRLLPSSPRARRLGPCPSHAHHLRRAASSLAGCSTCSRVARHKRQPPRRWNTWQMVMSPIRPRSLRTAGPRS